MSIFQMRFLLGYNTDHWKMQLRRKKIKYHNHYNGSTQYIYIYILVFANSPGDWGSIPGHVIPKTLKMVLDTSLLNTQQYKVRIKSTVEQSRERSSALPYTSVYSYWKESLLVALDYGRQLNIYIYIYIYLFFWLWL